MTAEALFSSPYVAFVGNGDNPSFPKHRVVVWSDTKSSYIIELEFKQDVSAVRLRKDRWAISSIKPCCFLCSIESRCFQLDVSLNLLPRMAVVLDNHIALYSFGSKPSKLAEYETGSNPLGDLNSLSPISSVPRLVCHVSRKPRNNPGFSWRARRVLEGA